MRSARRGAAGVRDAAIFTGPITKQKTQAGQRGRKWSGKSRPAERRRQHGGKN
jgi:hypothetical protein